MDAIGKTYEETRANILSPDGETEFLKTSTDVLQGDTLAPYLFIIVLHYVLREAIEGHQERFGLTIKPRQGRGVKDENVTDLIFADDIALFSDQFQQAQDLFRSIEEASAQVGFYQMQKHHVDLGLKTRDDEIEPVENFQYMGSWISDSGHDFKIRKASAWIACNKMRKVWTSKMARGTTDGLE